MSSKLHIDHSRRSTFDSCPRKYYYRYIRNLSPAMGSNALRYGSTWHGFLDGFYRHIKDHGWSDSSTAMEAAFAEGKRVWDTESSLQSFHEDDYRTFENCTKSFLEYINYFAADKGMLDVIDVEKAFSIYMEDFVFTGKLDLQVELNGMPWLLEHKTTGQYLSGQVERLQRSAQTIGYYHACRLIGLDMEGVLISFHHLSSRKKKDGSWGALNIDFQRTPQIYPTGALADWYTLFQSTVRSLTHCLDTATWPKQYDSCYQYGRCTFLPLCDQYRPIGEEEASSYIIKPWNVLETVQKKDIIYA